MHVLEAHGNGAQMQPIYPLPGIEKNIITPVNLLFGEYVDFFLDVYMVYSLHNSDPRENGLPFSVFGRKEFRVDILTQCPRFPRSQLVWGLRGSCARA